jgi:uncharacterized membrane protein YcjF (UPF0283 family)
MTLDLIFAYVVAALAGIAVIGALVVAIVAEWYALRNVIQRNRPPKSEGRFWSNHAALTSPERRP